MTPPTVNVLTFFPPDYNSSYERKMLCTSTSVSFLTVHPLFYFDDIRLL